MGPLSVITVLYIYKSDGVTTYKRLIHFHTHTHIYTHRESQILKMITSPRIALLFYFCYFLFGNEHNY